MRKLPFILITASIASLFLVSCSPRQLSNSTAVSISTSISSPTSTSVSEPTSAVTQTPTSAISLDGRGGGFIAFYSERDGNAEIYIMNADGSAETRLTQNGVLNLAPDLSPDT